MAAIGYFPGCSLHGSALEFDHSVRAVARELGEELREVPDWICCGSSSAHVLDSDAALVLPAYTLAKAFRAGLREVLAPCAMCFQRLRSTAHKLAANPALAEEVARALGAENAQELAQVRTLSILEWLERMPPERVRNRIKQPLKGLKVACYYGCLLVRPPKITGVEEPEAPRSMEKLVSLLGATPVRWGLATECCGASFSLSRKPTVLRQSRRIYELAHEAGADVLCLACPMCHSNLDMRQDEFLGAEQARLPALYIAQLVGLAFDLGPPELGLDHHFVPAAPALEAAAARETNRG